MKKILFVTHSNLTALGGGPYMSKFIFDAISIIYSSYDIDLMCPEEVSSKFIQKRNLKNIYGVKRRSLFTLFIQSFRLIFHRYRIDFELILKKNPEYQVIILDGSLLAGDLAPRIKKNGVKIISIHHNVDFKYYTDNQSIITLNGLFPYLVKHIQKKALIYSNLNLTLSKNDENDLSVFSKIINIETLGVFEQINTRKEFKFKVKKIRLENFTVSITGSLKDYQTEKSLIRFFEQHYDSLIQLNNINIIVAGRDPTQKLKTFFKKYEKIELISNPIDINDIVRKSDLYICPVDCGSGVKLRVMDGLRNGIPVLVNKVSASGYEELIGYKWFDFYTENNFSIKLKQMFDYISSNEDILDEVKKNYWGLNNFNKGVHKLEKILKKNKLV
jgi:hypothetical protein